MALVHTSILLAHIATSKLFGTVIDFPLDNARAVFAVNNEVVVISTVWVVSLVLRV